MEIKQLIRTLNIGQSQVVKTKEIKDYLFKAIEIADKQLEALSRFFKDEDIPSPSLSEILISDAKDSGLNDRLILTHTTAATAYIASAYGLTLPDMLRKDLIATIFKLTSEVLGLAKDGAELMVELGWMERIPEAADRQELSH